MVSDKSKYLWFFTKNYLHYFSKSKLSEELNKKNTSSAKPKQKSASKKMKSIAEQMSSSMEGGEQEQLEEDVAMLRQILDNLLAYSFSQEDVMNQFKGLKRGSPSFNKNLKKQMSQKFNRYKLEIENCLNKKNQNLETKIKAYNYKTHQTINRTVLFVKRVARLKTIKNVLLCFQILQSRFCFIKHIAPLIYSTAQTLLFFFGQMNELMTFFAAGAFHFFFAFIALNE